jgi:hypothetical protein
VDLKKAVERHGKEAAGDDLLLWAASIWAMEDGPLEMLAQGFRTVIGDDGRDGDERRAASYLLDAVECGLRAEVPSLGLMRAASAALGAIPRGGDL